MGQKRCLVNAAVLAPEYGKTLTVGQMVDLDERLPGGGTLADMVRPEWFEELAVDPEPVTRRRRTPPTHDELMPAAPAAEE